MTVYILLALIPFLVFCLLLSLHPTASLLKISFISLVATITIALIFWSLPISTFFYSLGRGGIVALDILVIVFGAILFLEVLRISRVTSSLAYYLDHFSPDLRVQVIMLAWFLENFIEGIAGFGAPATIVAPLLVTLGITPFKSVVIALIGNSVAGTFGAVGTPIRVGFAGIPVDHIAVGSASAIYNYVGILVPVFMLWVLVSSLPRRSTLFRQGLPFALWSGAAYVAPSYIASLFGIELPTILGAVVGVLLVLFTKRMGLFMPTPIYRHTGIKITNPLSLFRTLLPYGLFIFLLVITKTFIHSAHIPIPLLNSSVNLFNPGVVLIIAAAIVSIFLKIKKSDIASSVFTAAKKSLPPFLVIIVMATVVQLMNNSANPSLNLPSMTVAISTLFTVSLLPAIAPFVGAFGSFITGSSTLSGIMFGPSLYSSSLSLGYDPVRVLSLTLTGAGFGNMVALADVLVARTVTAPDAPLRKLIFSILPYALTSLLLVSLLGLIF